MEHKRKRRLSAVCAGVLILALTACGGNNTQGGASGAGSGASTGRQSAALNKDLIFRETPLTLSGTEYASQDLNQIFYLDGRIYATGTHYTELLSDEEKEAPEEDAPQAEEGTPDAEDAPEEETEIIQGYNTFFMVSFSTDGGDVKTTVLEERMPDNSYYNGACFDEAHNLYTVKTLYPMYGEGDDIIAFEDMASSSMPVPEAPEEEISEEEMPGEELPPPATEEITDEEAPSDKQPADEAPRDVIYNGETERYFLIKYDESGEKLFETEVEAPEDAEWYSVSSMYHVPDLGLVVCDSTGIRLFSDEDGSAVKMIYETEDWPDLYRSGRGDLYLLAYEQGGMTMTKLDLQKGELGEKVEISQTMWMYDIYNLKPGIGSDFLLTNESGIYAWNIDENMPKQILSYIDSDLDMNYLQQYVQISEDEIVAFYWKDDATSSSYVCTRLTKVPPEEVGDRTVLTLGVNFLESDVRREVVNFNRNNSQYRISVVDYNQYNTDGDWQAGYNKLNQDLIAGNAPDMMILDLSSQIESYEAKGILEPLDDYFANDPELNIEDYLTNVFDAYRYQGKLYIVTPTFSARSYAMSARNAAEIESWDYATMAKMIEERGIKYTEAFGYPVTNTTLVQIAVILDSATYIDFGEGRAKFDTRQFIDLLDLAKKFPSEDQLPDEWWNENNESFYREGRALIAQAYFDSFGEYAQMRYATFDEEIAFVGFPRENGQGGSTVSISMQLAMNAAAYDKDACWQFMRSFLTKDYQARFVDSYGLPVLRSALEEKAARSMQRPYWEDETGEKHYYDDTYYINGEEIIIPPLTQEDVDQCMALFTSLDTSFSYNEKILSLVMEEVEPFFAGQKNAEEVAKIIQSKVQVYLDENG